MPNTQKDNQIYYPDLQEVMAGNVSIFETNTNGWSIENFYSYRGLIIDKINELKEVQAQLDTELFKTNELLRSKESFDRIGKEMDADEAYDYYRDGLAHVK